MAKSISVAHQISTAVVSDDVASFVLLMQSHPDKIWESAHIRRTTWMALAADRGCIGIMKVLVDSGVDVNAPQSIGSNSPPEGVVDTAASEGRLDATRWLLDQGAILNHEVDGQLRCFALSSTAAAGHLEVVKLLIERGAAINASWSGMTALDHALAFGKLDVAEYLRSIGGVSAVNLK